MYTYSLFYNIPTYQKHRYFLFIFESFFHNFSGGVTHNLHEFFNEMQIFTVSNWFWPWNCNEISITIHVWIQKATLVETIYTVGRGVFSKRAKSIFIHFGILAGECILRHDLSQLVNLLTLNLQLFNWEKVLGRMRCPSIYIYIACADSLVILLTII